MIESRLDKTRGPIATLLVQNGTLHVGDSVVAGDTYGKMRAMFDDKGQPITRGAASTPVLVLGLSDVPTAGDTFAVVADERTREPSRPSGGAKKRGERTHAAPKARRSRRASSPRSRRARPRN